MKDLNTQITAVFSSSASVRIVMIDDGPWFCVADICDVLGYVNSRDALAKHCRESGVAKRDIRSGGQMRELTFINEGNLYRLIIKSRKPEAVKFESWVCDEVLPAIRKTGYYVSPEALPEPMPARPINGEELAKLKRAAKGVARYFQMVSTDHITRALYNEIKTPLRIGTIADLPLAELDRSLAWLKATEAKARAHWLAMCQYEGEIIAELGIRVIAE